MSLPCPACGFLTFSEELYGSYEVCKVCGWEDDGLQLANPACGGGANPSSLIDAQAAALAALPPELTEVSGISRASEWRPLSDAEIRAALSEREAVYWRNKATVDPFAAY